MTENKRFTFVRDNNKSIGILDNKYERKCLKWGQIARLLNELNDEKSKLKIENKQLKNEIEELKELLNLKISERTFFLEQELKE